MEIGPIIHLSRIFVPLLWDIEEICQAQMEDPAPTSCPPGHAYIPTGIRDRLLTWAHTSLATGHPGINRITHALSLKNTGGSPWFRMSQSM